MSARVRTGLLLFALFLAVLFFGGQVVFALAVAGLVAVGAREYQLIASPAAGGLEAFFIPLWAGAVSLSFLGGSGAPAAALALGALLYFAGWIFGSGPAPDTLRRWGGGLGAVVVVGYLLGHAVVVRRHGLAPVFFLGAVVWVGDIAAYYVGSAFGERRLAALVSPKKSVEGAVASLAAAAATALVFGLLLPVPHGPLASALLGVALNVAAQLGDLAESLLKRCAGVKDSGTLFPGHGGVLDRLDGFLFALPLYASFLQLGAG